MIKTFAQIRNLYNNKFDYYKILKRIKSLIAI